MKIKTALEIIRAEVAENGEVTSKAMRLYIENRISFLKFNKTVQDGIEIYSKRKG